MIKYILGLFCFAFMGFQAYTQDSLLLKSESWFLNGKSFKHIEYDSVGREIFRVEKLEKELPYNTRNEVSSTNYFNRRDTLVITKSMNAVVQKNGTVKLDKRRSYDGYFSILLNDSLTDRHYHISKRFNLSGKGNIKDIEELMIHSLEILFESSFPIPCKVLSDSNQAQMIYQIYAENYEGFETWKFDQKSGQMFYKESYFNYPNQVRNFWCEYISDSLIHIEGCYYGFIKDHCYARDEKYIEGKKVKTIKYKNFQEGEKVEKIEYTIDYFYPHPTIEKQIIQKGNKKIEIVIRKKYYSPTTSLQSHRNESAKIAPP